MIKSYLCGAGLAAMLAAGAAGAAAPAPGAEPQAWVITPADDSCQTELDLTGHSGVSVPVTLSSDGEHLALKFDKPDLPTRAFLAVRIDRKPYSNIILRDPNAKTAVMTLSADTEAALRKGGQLQIGWLADEPLSASLSGSEHGIPDLRTCGAQVAGQWRANQAAQKAAQAQAEADARAKAVTEAQLKAAQAQAAAADAERQKVADEMARQQAAADAEKQREAMAEQAAQRQREAQAAYDQGQDSGYGQGYGYRRAYAPAPAYGYARPSYGQPQYPARQYPQDPYAQPQYQQPQAYPSDDAPPPASYGYRSGW